MRKDEIIVHETACTPKKCVGCGFIYHWAGLPSQVERLAPVQDGMCPACWTGRVPVTNGRPCPRCPTEPVSVAPTNMKVKVSA